MTILILIDPVDGDDRLASSESVLSQSVRVLRGEVLAKPRHRRDERPSDGKDDPLLESWQKLLAKYRRK